MKKLAGQDFEDILQVTPVPLSSSSVPLTQFLPQLQCIIPIFEGLLPRVHNNIVIDLLFELATWHTFMKLQVYIDKTLEVLTAAIKTLMRAMRRFHQETCEAFITVELPKEAEAHGRCTAALTAKGHSRQVKKKASTSLKQKKFNLATYKYHALADYAKTI
jgi:hypothetical protein